MDALLPLDGEKVDEMEMLKKLATINNLADDTIVVRQSCISLTFHLIN